MNQQEQLKQMQDMLQKAADKKARERIEADRNAVFSQVGKYIAAAMKPFNDAVQEMKRMASSHERMAEDMHEREMPAPEFHVDLSSIRIPPPQVTVKPIVDVSGIKMPKDLDVKGWVGFMGYDRSLLTNPLPVQLRDASGNPIKLFENLTQIVGGGGGGWGGGGNHVVVDNLNDISITSSGSSSISLVNADGAYYNSANPLPVTMTASGSSSISLVNADGTYYNSDNPLPVTFSAASVQPVSQVSGAEWSTASHLYGLDTSGAWDSIKTNTGVAVGALRVVQAVDSVSSVNIMASGVTLGVQQVSGAIDSVSIVSNIAALDVKQVSGSMNSVNVMQVGGNAIVVGTGYQDNAIRVVHATDAIASVNIVSSATITVTGSLTSSVSVGATVADAVDDGSAPVQMGGIARTANPTAVAGGDVVKASMDDLGRQLVRPVQVRDLIQTARATLTNGTETTLLAGSSGIFNDLIYVMAANSSDAAVSVDIRSASAAGIQFTIQIPASGTAGVALPVPIPQDVAADTWTADLPDITGTTVSISALFSKEV